MTEFRYDPARARVSRFDYQKDCEAQIADALAINRPALLHVATGGGKTFIANNAVANALSGGGGHALWVAKDWWLLRQAALDMAQRHRRMARRLRRVGGEREAIRDLPSAASDNPGRVVYTTLQTFKRRLDDGDDLFEAAPRLVVWDECHWGYAGKTGKALLEWAKDVAAPVLGLTGTPKSPEAFTLACRHTFKDLMDKGYLARPEVRSRRTGVSWKPKRNRDGDFTGKSLRELSTNNRRNRQIVKEYLDNVDLYDKTLVFACNIKHADLLAQRLSDDGVAARPVHSRREQEENERAIRQFASGEVEVLVNVAKMTTGVDIPDIRTVFLCRPTASDILFAQMVGRGARRADGMESFNIVEFTDNVVRFEHVWSASAFIGAELGLDGKTSRRSRNWPLRFDPEGAPTWTEEDGPEAAQDIWYREGQTFGVEFELTCAGYDEAEPDDEDWHWVASALVDRLKRCLGSDRVRSRTVKEYGTPGYEKWKVEYDSSAGWEVVSPVLCGREGLLELVVACEALRDVLNDEDLGLTLNHRTGTHVHIGWLADDNGAARVIELTHLLEPLLRTLVHPSRFAEYDEREDRYDTECPNPYCRPVSSVYPIDQLDDVTTLRDLKRMAQMDRDDSPRTVTFNPSPLWESDDSHVEVRLLNGTTDAEELLGWVSLWMRILWAAGRQDPVSDYNMADPAENFPDLDVKSVLKVIGLPAEREAFLERLRRQQERVFDLWRRHKDLRAWLPAQQPAYQRSLPDIDRTLRSHGVVLPDSRQFNDLDEYGRRCAIWCVLDGEGELPRDDSTIRKCAERLQEANWASFVALGSRSRLYRNIQSTLDSATRQDTQERNVWLDIPLNRYVRAYRLFSEMSDEAWRDCVMRTLSSRNGSVERDEAIRDAFDEARTRYGIDRQNLTEVVKRPIRSAINSCIRREFIERDGRRLKPLAGYDDLD